jgi:hypothetical protein
MKIQLHIERLILDGLPIERRDGAIVQAAVEAELARLLTVEGPSNGLLSGGATPAARGGSIQLERKSNPAGLGTEIARAVFRGLGNE